VAVSLLVIRRKNITIGIVALWAFFGIILKRQEAAGAAAFPVTIGCIAAMAVIVLASLIQLMKKR
jgi:hypothetical protein